MPIPMSLDQLGRRRPVAAIASGFSPPLIPKLSLTFVVTWLPWRSNNLYSIALVAAFCSTPVLNNLISHRGHELNQSHRQLRQLAM